MWDQFRRLLLGTVIELLLDAGVRLDFATIRIEFDDRSEFRVPRLDNYMRFSGRLTGRLASDVDADTLEQLRRQLRRAWPALLEVVDIPIGDRLTEERNRVEVSETDGELVVRFDLAAD